MKKIYLTLIVITLIVMPISSIADEELPYRVATSVDSVYDPYTAEEWIISPDEEPQDDHKSTKVGECDINGIISCVDEDYLRVDILLANSITYEWDTFYAIRVEYDTMTEYYTYYTDTKKLVYEKEKGGKIVKTITLTESNSKDLAGATDSGEGTDDDVYFIINKKDHIGGAKGKLYYLTCNFYSGYVNENNKLTIADDTMTVNLKFKF